MDLRMASTSELIKELQNRFRKTQTFRVNETDMLTVSVNVNGNSDSIIQLMASGIVMVLADDIPRAVASKYPYCNGPSEAR